MPTNYDPFDEVEYMQFDFTRLRVDMHQAARGHFGLEWCEL